jgi:putative flippase GtrA
MNVKPTKKVAAGGIGAAVSTLLVWILAELGVEVPPAVAASASTIIGLAAAWLRSETA